MTTPPNPAKLTPHKRLVFLFKDSVIYGGGMAVSRAFSLITFPLLARHLSVAEYGILDLFMVITTFLVIAIIFGQDSAIGRFFYEYDNLEQRKQIISQSLLIQSIVCIVAVTTLILLLNYIAGFISKTEEATRYFAIVLAQVPFTLMITFAQNLLKWTFSRWHFLIMSIGYAVVQTIGLTFTVLFFNLTIETVLLVYLANNILFGLLGLYMVRSWLIVPQSINHIGELLRYALPVGFICMLGAIVPILERQFIEKLLGNEQLGLYAAGFKLTILLTLVTGAFQTAWGPFSTSIHREQNAARTYNLTLNCFSLLVCVLAMLLDGFAKPLITLLASERYVDATVVIFPLTMATAIQATGWITEVGIGFSKRTALLAYSYLVFMTILVITMFILIPLYGLLGIALSVLLAQIIRSIVASWLAQRVYPLNWDYTWAFTIVLYTLVTGFLINGLLKQYTDSPTVSVITYLIASLFLCICFWYRIMSVSNREFIASLICRLKK